MGRPQLLLGTNRSHARLSPTVCHCGASQDSRVRLWRVQGLAGAGSLVATLSGSDAPVGTLAFTADSARLIKAALTGRHASGTPAPISSRSARTGPGATVAARWAGDTIVGAWSAVSSRPTMRARGVSSMSCAATRAASRRSASATPSTSRPRADGTTGLGRPFGRSLRPDSGRRQLQRWRWRRTEPSWQAVIGPMPCRCGSPHGKLVGPRGRPARSSIWRLHPAATARHSRSGEQSSGRRPVASFTCSSPGVAVSIAFSPDGRLVASAGPTPAIA